MKTNEYEILEKMMGDYESSLEGTEIENSHLNDLSSLEIIKAKAKDKSPTTLSKGFKTKKKIKDIKTSAIYENSFLYSNFITDITYTNKITTAIFGAVGSKIEEIAVISILILSLIKG